jgi:hypothetical protein
MKKTAKVNVSFQGYDWRNEFRMRSPTGRTITLHCNGKWKFMSPELLELINKYQYGLVEKRTCACVSRGARAWGMRPVYEEIVTHDLMREVLTLSQKK